MYGRVLAEAGSPTNGSDERQHGSGESVSRPELHLPANRRSSPWSRRALLISVLAVVLLASLWLDPVTLGQLRGASPQPTPAPGRSPATTADRQPPPSGALTDWQSVGRDDFERIDPNGWGRAPLGGAWQFAPDSGAPSISGGAAQVAVEPGTGGQAILQDVIAHNVEVAFAVSVDALIVHSWLDLRTFMRYQPGGGAYIVELVAADNGELAIVALASLDGSTWRPLGVSAVVPDLALQPGTSLRVRAAATGIDPTQINIRVWAASAPEPDYWHVSVIDWTGPLQGSGMAGLGWQLNSGAQGAQVGPVILRFDDLVVRAADSETLP